MTTRIEVDEIVNVDRIMVGDVVDLNGEPFLVITRRVFRTHEGYLNYTGFAFIHNSTRNTPPDGFVVFHDFVLDTRLYVLEHHTPEWLMSII